MPDAAVLRQMHRRRRRLARVAVLGDYVRINAAAHPELGGEAHEARRGGPHQIIKYPVGDGLVEGAFVAEGPHVELQGFELDAALMGHVIDEQSREIRLAGLKTQTKKHEDTKTKRKNPTRERDRERL